MFLIISEYNIRKVNAQTSALRQRSVIIDIVLFNYEDRYISLVEQSLEDIQRQNEGKVKFNFTTLKLTYLTKASKNIQLRYTHSKVGSKYSI